MPTFFTKIHRRLSGTPKSSSSPGQSSLEDSIADSSRVSQSHLATAPRTYERTDRLINLSALLSDQPLSPDPYQREWFKRVNVAVRKHLDNEGILSHDYEHVLRVVMNTQRLWLAEKHHTWARDVDVMAMYTTTLVCCVGQEENEWGVSPIATLTETETEVQQDRQCNKIRDFLDGLKVPPQVAGPASYIASFLSFPRERSNPEALDVAINDFPALKIVQDAQRLDSLGAAGIARAANFMGSVSIVESLKLVDERFAHYPGLMKTKTGKKDAEKAWGVMQAFREGLLEQVDCEEILEAEEAEVLYKGIGHARG